ncbi:hypothetical protein HMPREF9306_01236 [Propionimicrobium lymphophilum ACS-093-V-SCH5]|uniref:Uncharacterized protein n=1 Tax=Propionimicrobium lymphophilum ACS-093-V-SCH5 TaxID=883161 RepID=S2VZG9_9ACTN|nr:hypothetical protein HMPREF9306_01236 [Propionimicrobium lymphophilum ACS-093-V-SCH5]
MVNSPTSQALTRQPPKLICFQNGQSQPLCVMGRENGTCQTGSSTEMMVRLLNTLTDQRRGTETMNYTEKMGQLLNTQTAQANGFGTTLTLCQST